MPTGLRAAAARRTVNPPLGTGKAGLRLFGDPIQAIESDLTATVLVLANGATKVAIVALDLCVMSTDEAAALRARVGDALGVPAAHVLLNLSHSHSTPALPAFMAMCDTQEESSLRHRYERDLVRLVVEAAVEAESALRPARVGCGWGESMIGVYRREQRDGRDVLGEVPDHPIDASVGVIRVDDLDGEPIAVLFRYSAHPVTVGPRSQVASSDYPGTARDVIERALGGLALFLQGCGGNVNPRVGIGYEIDCRDTKKRVGLDLGGEVLKVAARIRTATRPGERRTLGTVPNILFTPWEPVGEQGPQPVTLAAAEEALALRFVELPRLEAARAILAGWEQEVVERRERDARDWEIRVALKYADWAHSLVDAVLDGSPTCDLSVQVVRIGDIVLAAMDAETFFETGLAIRARSRCADTFVLGYSNGLVGYLPRAEDYPPGGWRIDESYSVPDLMPQAWGLPAAFHPEAEERAVELTLSLVESVWAAGNE